MDGAQYTENVAKTEAYTDMAPPAACSAHILTYMHKGRETEIQTETYRHNKTEKIKNRKTESQKDGKAVRWQDLETGKWSDEHRNGATETANRNTQGQGNCCPRSNCVVSNLAILIHKDRQTYKQPNKQTVKQTHRQKRQTRGVV